MNKNRLERIVAELNCEIEIVVGEFARCCIVDAPPNHVFDCDGTHSICDSQLVGGGSVTEMYKSVAKRIGYGISLCTDSCCEVCGD